MPGAALSLALSKPTPRGLRWLDRLEDRCAVWALPWMLAGVAGGLAALVAVAAVWFGRWLR